MCNAKRLLIAGGIAVALAGAVMTGVALRAADAKVPDPTSVVMIVNRDSNDIAFMDIKTKKIVGKTFLGNNVNPHMVMMSPDGRYVVTGGTRGIGFIVGLTHSAAAHGFCIDAQVSAADARVALFALLAVGRPVRCVPRCVTLVEGATEAAAWPEHALDFLHESAVEVVRT